MKRTSLLRGMYFGDLPQLDLHGSFVADVPDRIDAFLDPFYVSGGYIRIVGGVGTGKIMSAIALYLKTLSQRGLITDYWEEDGASFIICI